MLSVIIPVYQAVDTLRKSVLSVLNQNVDEMEVILIDDGSNDGSSAICDYFGKEYSNVFVKHIKNSGPYQARRQGALMAHGDIITFVDADDWIDHGAYSLLINLFESNDVDILLFAYKYNHDGEACFHLYDDGLYQKKDIENEILPSMMWNYKLGRRNIDPSLCCKIMKKELFLSATNDVDERINWGDDAAVSYPMIAMADRIYIYNATYYHYCISDNSNTRIFPINRIKELQDFRKVLANKLSSYSDRDFSWQIDCYIRIFLDMLSVGWFGCHIQLQRYVFPFNSVKQGSKIKLYGAGDVGKSYYLTIIQTEYVQLTGWYDKNAANIRTFVGQNICDTSSIRLEDDECILIAVQNEKISEEIKSELMDLGISKEQIVWKAPLTMY